MKRLLILLLLLLLTADLEGQEPEVQADCVHGGQGPVLVLLAAQQLGEA